MKPILLGFLYAFASGSLLTAYCLAIRKPSKPKKLRHFLQR